MHPASDHSPKPKPAHAEPPALKPHDHQDATLPDSPKMTSVRPSPNVVDDATVTRVLNTLWAEGLFDRPPGEAATSTRGQPAIEPALARPAQQPAGRASTMAGRMPTLAWACCALLSAALALAWLGGGETPSPRTPPADLQAKDAAADPAQKVHSRAPDADAAQLVALLAGHGLRAEVVPIGAERLVRASIPESAMAAVEPLLTAQGLIMPSDGRLAVQFAP